MLFGKIAIVEKKKGNESFNDAIAQIRGVSKLISAFREELNKPW